MCKRVFVAVSEPVFGAPHATSTHLRHLQEVLQLPVDVVLDGALAEAEVPEHVEGEASTVPPLNVLGVSDSCGGRQREDRERKID